MKLGGALRIAIACIPVFSSVGAAAGEQRLSGNEIRGVLTNKTVAGTDNGKPWTQLFQESGQTVYTIGGSPSQGFWEVRGDQYCSQWPPNESWSCYDMTIDGKTVTFISSSGKRYPSVVRE